MSAVVTQPQPDQEAVKTLIRAFQQEIIDADPDTYMGALTADYGPESYVTVRGQGRYLLNAATNRLISAQMATAMLARFGAANPTPPRLDDTPDEFLLTRLLVQAGTLNAPIQGYLAQFSQALKDAGFDQTVSLPGSIDAYMPSAWVQRDLNAVAGSTMSYSNLAARAFSTAVLVQALSYPDALGEPVRFELNNEGWQVDANGTPYIYDLASQTGYGNVPEPLISNIHTVGAEQLPYLTYLNATLVGWQNSVGTAVLTAYPTAQVGIVVDSAKILEPESANVLALNQSVTGWSSPQYNFVRMQDNSWVAARETEKVPQTFDLALQQLGYGIAQVQYTLGPVGTTSNPQRSWRNVDDAWGYSIDAGVPTTFVWDYGNVVQYSVLVGSSKICGC